MAGRLKPVINIGGTLFVHTVDPKPIHFDFVVGDWASDGGGKYYLDIPHNFNELKMPQVQFMEGSNITIVSNIAIQDKDTLRVKIPGSPDCRFSGSVRLSRV